MQTLVKLSNFTFPIAWWYLIIGLLYGFIRIYVIKSIQKNNETSDKLYPLVKKIKDKKLDEETETEELSRLYKEHNYNAIKPMVLRYARHLLTIFIIFPLIRINEETIFGYTNSLSFLWIDDIFRKGGNSQLALLVSVIGTIPIVTRIKLTNIKNILRIIVDIVSSFLINLLCGKFLSGAALLYMLGQTLVISIYKIKKQHTVIKNKKTGYTQQVNTTEDQPKNIISASKDLYTSVDKLFDYIIDTNFTEPIKKSKQKKKKS